METLAVTEYTHSRVSERQTEKTVPRPVFAAGDAGKTVKIQSIYKKKKKLVQWQTKVIFPVVTFLHLISVQFLYIV